MNTYNKLRLSSLHRIQDLCIANATALTAVTDYPPLKVSFDSGVTKIEIARAINEQNISNFATVKDANSLIMVETTYKYMLRGAFKASELHLPGLEKLLNIKKSKITSLDDDAIAVKCTEIKEILNTNIATLTNILPADITSIDDAIKAYKLSINSPKEAIDNRSNYGTKAIDKLFNDVEPHKINMGRVFHSYLPADAASAFDLAAKIGKPSGRRHVSIIMKFRDADTGDPVINVTTTFTKGSLTEIKKSSKRGCIQIYSLEVGAWTATSVSEIYNTVVNTNISVGDKRTARITLKLQKKVQPDDGTTPVTTGYGNGYGTMYDSVSLEPIAKGLVFLDKVAEPIETDDDGSWGNDHIPADSKTIRGSADGYANYFKNITITPDSDNEIDLPMDPIDDGPPAPDA